MARKANIQNLTSEALMNHLNLSFGCENPPKGSIFYLHNKSASPSGAFTVGEKMRVRIVIPRILGTYEIKARYFTESGEKLCEIDGVWKELSGQNEIYEFYLSDRFEVGLYFFDIQLTSCCGLLYACKSRNEVIFKTHADTSARFQMSVSSFKYTKPLEIYGGIIYHIFVDRFARGGKVAKRKDAVIVDDWSCGIPEYPEYPGAYLKNNTFYGGTLFGITEKLPYIASLGVNAIYLSPIFESVSNHKYDTSDYMRVDTMFGGEKALKALISAAREHGIQIILDGVFNHTGDDSVYFNRYGRYSAIGAYQSKNSPYYEWYKFNSYPDDYVCWWGIEILPRINPDTPECRRFFAGRGGVVDKYAKMGIGGFRLDVVDELSDEFVSDIKARLNESNPGSVIYGEVWEDASNKIAYDKRKRYYLGSELDAVMNYPLRRGIIDYILYRKTDELHYALTDIIYNAPKRIRDAQMNLLGTHDTERILTLLSGVDSSGKSNGELRCAHLGDQERKLAIKRLKMAYAIIATLPGIPSIFYGDEAGLEGYNDPFNRMPFPWGKECKELLDHYIVFGDIRRNNAVYAEGDYRLLLLNKECLIFSRTLGRYSYITLVNNSDKHMRVSFADKGATAMDHDESDCIPPITARIFKVARKTDVFYNFTT